MGAMPGAGDAFGRYRVEGLLGQGGMGVVLTAVHEDLGRRVALKLLAPQLVGSPDMVARFRREAMALARLDSPHVVQVYDTGEHDGWLYIATQLIPDGDLTALVGERGPLAPTEALALVDQVLAGLADAHAVGLIHRDVKPSNVLLRNEAAGVRAYLCDFGIAQAVDVHSTEQTQGVIGTWAYLAPERFDGHPATVRADLYAAGCVLWYLVTGRLPYEGSMVQLALAHQTAPVPQLPGSDPWSHAVNQLLRRSMAKDPADRFSSAQEMQAFLRSVVAVAGSGHGPSAVTAAAMPPTMAGPGRTLESTRDRVGPAQSPPAAVPPPAPPVPGPLPARRRGRVLAVLAVALLLVAGSAGALAAAGVFSTEEPAAVSRDGGAAAPGTEVADSASGGAAESADPEEAGPMCWNGARVDSLDQCVVPTGVRGLRWVFPLLDDTCTDLRLEDPTIRRPALWECYGALADGTQVKVNYSMWNAPGGGDQRYRQQYGDPTPVSEGGRVAFHRWEGSDKGLHKIAITYVDYAFGVTIYTPTPEQGQRAIDEGVARWRPAAEVRGTPAGGR